MTRVLQVYKTDFPAVRGGVDLVVSNLLRHPPPGFHCALLRTAAWTERGVTARRIDDIEVLALHLPVPPAKASDFKQWLFLCLHAPRALLALRRLLKSQAIALVHLHTLQFYQLYFVLCRWLGGPPFVVTLHRAEVLAYHQRHWTMRAVWRLALTRAAAVNAVSAWLTAEAQRRLPFVRQIECITNGIAPPHAALPDGAHLRARLGLPARYLCMIGVLEAYKGHDIALRAWPQVDDDSALVVIGSGSALKTYQRLCAELGISARVHFVGQLAHDDALALLRDSQAMIMPSRNEGLGLTVLEAGVVGVPVIASDIGPFREMLTDQQTGLLFASEDSAALATAVNRLVADAALRERLAQAFSAHVRAHFSFDTNARLYADYYRRALQQGARA